MKFKPLRHGDRFTCLFGDTVGMFRNREWGVPVDPERAIRESWVYANVQGMYCTAEEEGLTWARGWRTKAANALRVAVAL